jgi:hypothetical protein
MVQAPLTGVASQFSAPRQLKAVYGSLSVRFATYQLQSYIDQNIVKCFGGFREDRDDIPILGD